MSEYKTSAELKSEAKDLLRGRWKDAILLNLSAVLVMLFVLFAVLGLLVLLNGIFGSSGGNIFSNGSSSTNGGGGGSGGGGGGIITALINIGIMYTFIEWHRNPSRPIRPLKDAFRVFSRKYFIPVVLIEILTAIFVFLWSLLLVIPGIIKSFAYSQAPFLYKDLSSREDVAPPTALECITESKELMDGHKMRLFLLDLSFIGWIFASMLTFGIGLIWLIPYMNATHAAFYNDLVEKRYNFDHQDSWADSF